MRPHLDLLTWHPQDRAVRRGDHLQVHPVHTMRAGIEGLVGGDAVDRDLRAVDDHVGHAPALRRPQRLAQLRGLLREQLDGLVDIAPGRRGGDAEPGPTSAKVSPLRRYTSTSRACRP
jgi:hypothetical protein